MEDGAIDHDGELAQAVNLIEGAPTAETPGWGEAAAPNGGCLLASSRSAHAKISPASSRASSRVSETCTSRRPSSMDGLNGNPISALER
ncbi:hypothetical protein ACQEVF_45100 [Nonomuraea polychroma]|uniref:hypothetical protein n=1 Tax=Nonomuraea polychroma TaxID=46176 RepID=UPI003D91441C